jgi:hypothetical protein
MKTPEISRLRFACTLKKQPLHTHRSERCLVASEGEGFAPLSPTAQRTPNRLHACVRTHANACIRIG